MKLDIKIPVREKNINFVLSMKKTKILDPTREVFSSCMCISQYGRA